MPSSIAGFTRGEIIAKVLDTLGRSGDITLQTRLQEDINLAQLDFWKRFDWKFGRKNGVADGLAIQLIAGQGVYILDTPEIGHEMRGTDVDKIYSIDPQYASVLTKVELREIRMTDPMLQQQAFPDCYALIDKHRIQVWPIPSTTVNGQILYVDGKVLPTFMEDDTDFPDIPIEYQDSFIQYLTVLAYKRENDPRWKELLMDFEKMIREDKQADLNEVESSLRMKWPEEEITTGRARDPRAVNWNMMFDD